MLTNCNGCPCLNSDYAYGETCNLGYLIQHRSELRSGEKRVPKDFDTFSDSCDLVRIVTGKETIYPKKLNTTI